MWTMPNALLLLVYLLAAARVVRLVTADRITEAPRTWLVDRLWARTLPYSDALDAARRQRGMGGEPPLGAYLVTCPWCVSVWVGAVAAPVVWFWGESPWLAIPALALALSHAVGILAAKGE